MYKITLYILSFLICGFASYSQQSWTLEACINYALEHNLTVKDLNYNVASNKERYKQAYRDILPSINASSGYNIRFGRSIDPNTNVITRTDFFSNSYFISANFDLFRGFQKLNTIKVNRFLYNAAKEDALYEKYLLAFRIMNAFYDILFFEDALKIAKEQESIALKNFSFVKRQIELGLKAKSDLYEAESTLISDQLNTTQVKNSLDASKLQLIQEMNLENTSTIQINTLSEYEETNEEFITDIDLNTIYEQALTFIPNIKSQELRVKAAKKDIHIARAALMPSLSVSGGYSTGFFETNIDAFGATIPFQTQIEDNASQFIGFSLQIPIFNGWNIRSRIKQQKIALERTENNLNTQKQQLNKNIQELVQNYKATQKEYLQTQQNQEASLLTFTITQKKYDKGLINALELITAKNLYATAQNQHIQMKLKLKVQEKTIAFYNGLPIFNINQSN